MGVDVASRDSNPAVPADFFTSVDPDGFLEAAILFKRNGHVLASWTRTASPTEIMTVMAATLLGSVETLLESLHAGGFGSVTLVAGGRRLFLQKMEPSAALLLVAHAHASDEALRAVARRVASRMPPPGAGRALRIAGL